MKKFTIIIFLIFIGFISFYFSEQEDNKYRIWKISSPTEIFADTNHNGIFDETTPITFPETKFIEYNKNYNEDKILSQLTEEEKFFLEYEAKLFSERTLKNRYVEITENTITVSGKNYEEILGSSGLFYKENETSKQNLIKKIRAINLDDYYIYNLKSGKLHKLSCKSGRESKKYKIVYKSFKNENSKLCRNCFKYQTPVPKGITQNFTPQKASNFKESEEHSGIKIYFLDLNKIFIPTESCTTSACKDLKKEINNAKTSIDFAVYGINNQPEITEALKNAAIRGVKIRWVCDFDKKNNNYYPDTEKLKKFLPDFTTDEAYEKKNKTAIMHNKFFIFDNQKVWTGSANITGTDLTGFNANYAILINSNEVTNIYLKEFEQMYENKFHKEKSKIQKSEIKLSSETSILPLFSPADNITEYIKSAIENAKHYIYIPIFFITQKELIQPLINAHNRGVEIKIINDATNARAKYSIHNTLRENGITVKTENYAGKMHMKSIIIDDELTITGSMNFTKSGNNYNDENVLIIKDKVLAKYMKNSFLYLWNKIPDKYLKFDPAAESYESIGSCYDGIDNDFDGKIDSFDEGCKYKKH